MSYYKKIFNKKVEIAGSSKGAKPAFMQPPDGTFSKIGYQVYEVLDLICEGPVAGLTNKNGLILEGNRIKKDFDSDLNKIGSNTKGVDRGVYYNDIPLRTEGGAATYGKYDINFMSGEEFQDGPQIVQTPRRLIKINERIKGPFDMTNAANGARNGTGSRDVRTEGKGVSAHLGANLSFVEELFNTSAAGGNFEDETETVSATNTFSRITETINSQSGRDFVNWQNFIPVEQSSKAFYHNNYDKNIKKFDVSLIVNSLNDIRSASTKGENESGRSKMGNQTPITITFEIAVGKVDKFGNETISAASFSTRSGKGITLGQGNGRIAVSGIVTSPYHISLEGINLPTIDDDDLYNFIRVRKIEYETYSSLVNREGAVGNIVEVIDENLLYPNSTIVESSVDAKYFPQVPSRTFRIKGKKVLIPSNYFPINDDGSDRRFCNAAQVQAGNSTNGNIIYSGEWNGTFKFGWTDNPAWIFYDLIVNTRYGVGAYLQDVNIVDKWSLYEMGMYCDAVTLNDGSPQTRASGAGRFLGLDDGFGGLEPRFSMNVYLADQGNAYETIQDFAKTFMGLTYYNNSVINIRMDRPHFFENFNRDDAFESQFSLATDSIITDFINPPKEQKFPPHLIFNNNNVVDGKFNYSDVDRNTKHNAIEVSYLDKRNNYTTKTEYIEDSESIKKIGLNFRSVDGLGITSRGQANRMARALVFEASNTSEKVSFSAGLDALMLEPGDVIQIDDELKSFTKNFGVILGTSGQQTYFDPDGTGTIDNIKTGLGPKSIIVQPAIGSNQLDYLTGGNLFIENPIGQSGIEQFYNETGADNELYKDIHQPQIIGLQLVPGGSGLTYNIKEGQVYLNIDNSKFFDSSTPSIRSSQWFSEKAANIFHGASYSVDASGRSPKYYRVISIQENYDNGFNVSAMIHHTGKFKFIENNISFDTNEDDFEPELQLSQIQRPQAPQSVTTGAMQKQADNTIHLPLTITHPASDPGDRFTVITEEPNSNIVVGSFGKSQGSTTNVTLKDNQKIDQVGEYTVNVLSELSSTNVRSTTGVSFQFTTNVNDFGFDATTDALVEYNDISLRTNYTNFFSGVDGTGSGFNSFVQNDENINAVFDLEFKDFFGNRGNEILSNVSGQKITLRDLNQNIIKENFLTLTNETEATITKDDLNNAFGYTGDGRFLVPPNVDFEVNKFSIDASSEKVINFEEAFSETPAVFVSQVITDIGHNKRKIGMVEVSPSSFTLTSSSTDVSSGNYIASKTGVFNIDTASKKIVVGSGENNAATGYAQIAFPIEFDVIPSVVVQLQKPDEVNNESRFCETIVKDVTKTGFRFVGFQPDGSNPAGTGAYAYIAATPGTFNVLTSTLLTTGCLNYGAGISGGADTFTFNDHTVLDNINKSSNSNFEYNYNQSAILAQRVGENNSMDNKCMAIFRTGNQNKLALHYFDKNNTGSGMAFASSDAVNNYIYITGTKQPHDLTTDFTLETWAKFGSNLTGKQYLFDHTRSGTDGVTGIGWFQSGNGKNYLQLNGTDYQATSGNINDGSIHNIKLVVDRDTNLRTFIDGSLNKTNTAITGVDGVNLYADTGYKLLSPMQSNQTQSGFALHEGGVFNYFGLFTSQVTTDYTSNPNGFASALSGDASTAFLIKTGLSSIVDLNGNDDGRNNTVAIVGNLLNHEEINQTGINSNINFIQISSTGEI